MSEPRPYASLRFQNPHPNRAMVVVNMVATLDGKTISGERDEPVMDLGSKVDHQALRDIEAAVDGVLIGAGTLRATPKLWYPAPLWRFVVTQSGELPWAHRFFTDAPERAVVVVPQESRVEAPKGVQRLAAPQPLDFGWLAAEVRQRYGIETLLVEGGSEVNAQAFGADVVDEFFLTLAPKIKLGRHTPTVAGGEPLPRSEIRRYRLVSCQPIGHEVYLRYAREHR